MDIFNDVLRAALETGIYLCPHCGEEMEFADDITLWCSKCEEELPLDMYGHEDDYDEMYPPMSDFIDEDEDDEDDEYEETYIDEREEWFPDD